MDETVFVIFGASGDLAKRKLLPAFHALIAQKKIKNFFIVGAAFDEMTAQEILQKVKEFIVPFKDAEVAWQELQNHFYYQQLNFKALQDYKELLVFIDELKKRYGFDQPNMLFYLAAPASFYCDITNNIAASGLCSREQRGQEHWQRIVYEKPFGSNLASALEINACIADYFNENQVFRIDHYLTKELVSNITLVRFTNAIFEPLWNNRFIQNVQIILSETEDIQERGVYYDNFGAISDVMQNHMLELLALIGMEAPEKLTGEYIREQRVKVLEKVQVIDSFVGQYEGYKKAYKVKPDSTTETYASALLRINNSRWAGVPFYLKTGKCLDKKETTIHIQFKTVDCLIEICPIDANVLTIEVSPRAGFLLRLNAKKPEQAYEVIPVTMEFCHSCIFGLREAQAYETLIEEVTRGEQSVSVRFDEIEYAWRIIDKMKAAKKELYTYPCGSDGPEEQKNLFDKKHGIKWVL